jgi:O-acetylserine/cysteine efflux transporter
MLVSLRDRPKSGKRGKFMPPLHIALALLVVAVWGTNFVVIKIGLRDFPPFLFATLRFAFSALPWLLFIRRPNVAWRWLALFGFFLGAGQFGFLFLAMRADISPGLASLIIQVQVFFTIGLSMLMFNERVSRGVLGGILLAASGLGVIAWHTDATVTGRGIIMVLAAALFWASANITVKKASSLRGARIDMLAFMVWSSVFAVPPLLALCFAFEGAASSWHSVAAAHGDAWLALLWQVIGNTLFGYVAWNWLLTRHDAAIITPFALLVPVFGMGASALLLDEPLPLWKISAAALVMAGLALITVLPRLAARRA